ncbi:hypothetical protein RCF19_31730 [Rhodococcus qingshengii]
MAVVGTIGVVVISPLLEAFGEEFRIVYDFTVEQSVEFVGIDAVGAFHFAVQPWGSEDLDVPNASAGRCQ